MNSVYSFGFIFVWYDKVCLVLKQIVTWKSTGTGICQAMKHTHTFNTKLRRKGVEEKKKRSFKKVFMITDCLFLFDSVI